MRRQGKLALFGVCLPLLFKIEGTPGVALLQPITERVDVLILMEGYFEPNEVVESLRKSMLAAAKEKKRGTPQKFIDNPQSTCQ